MYPYIYQSSSLTIGSYGVMLAVAYLVGRFLYIQRLNQASTTRINTEALIIALLVFGVLGAKLMFALKNPEEASLTDWSSLTSGSGFSSQGAILAAIIVTAVFAKLSKVKLSLLLDSAAPAAVLAYAIARIGCFLAGDDCYGIESNLPWAMAFPEGIQKTQLTVHPLPLYECVYSIGIFLALEKIHKQGPPPFYVFFALLTLWGACRFLVEFLSVNPIKLMGMSGSQFGALIMLISGLTFFTNKIFVSVDKKKPGQKPG